jgi:hypothetical protein
LVSISRWRVSTWILLLFAAGMAWLFFSNVGGFCDEYSGLELEACRSGEYGYDLGLFLILSLWLWGTVALLIVWLVTRRRFKRRQAVAG